MTPRDARQLERLQGGVVRSLDRLLSRVQAREVSAREATRRAASILTDAHQAAAALGARAAGGNASEWKRGLGKPLGRIELDFARGLLADARAGRYLGTEEGARALTARATLYALKLTGTANQAYAGVRQSQEEGGREPELVHWHLSDAASCDECPTIAAGSPYTWETLPTTPGAGDTPCLSRCQCSLEVEGAQVGFSNR